MRTVVLAATYGAARQYIGVFGLNSNYTTIVRPQAGEVQALHGLTGVSVHVTSSWRDFPNIENKIKVEQAVQEMYHKGRLLGFCHEAKQLDTQV